MTCQLGVCQNFGDCSGRNIIHNVPCSLACHAGRGPMSLCRSPAGDNISHAENTSCSVKTVGFCSTLQGMRGMLQFLRIAFRKASHQLRSFGHDAMISVLSQLPAPALSIASAHVSPNKWRNSPLRSASSRLIKAISQSNAFFRPELSGSRFGWWRRQATLPAGASREGIATGSK